MKHQLNSFIKEIRELRLDAQRELSGPPPQPVYRRRVKGGWSYFAMVSKDGTRHQVRFDNDAEGKRRYEEYLRFRIAAHQISIAERTLAALKHIRKFCDTEDNKVHKLVMDYPSQYKDNRDEYGPADHCFKTLRGEYVKSKAEANIADALFRHGIPYEYEKPLKLKNGKTIYPDFTVSVSICGREVYWEHFGMMDKPNYVLKYLRKKRDMEEVGIVEGRNYITTFEFYDQNQKAQIELDNGTIERIINEWFCP